MSDQHRSSLFRQSYTILTSMIISGVFTLLVSISLARFLGPTEFGLYALVFSIQTVFGTIAFFYTGPAMAKFIAESPADGDLRQRWIAKIGLIMISVSSLITALAYVALSNPIGSNLYGNPDIIVLIPFSALVVVSSAFQGAAFGIVQGLKKIRYMALIQISVPMLNLLLIFILVPLIGISGAFLASATAQAIVAISMLLLLSRKGFSMLTPVPKSFRPEMFKKLLSFSLPSTMSSLLTVPMYWLGNTEMEYLAGLGAVGLFAVAYTLHNMFLVLPNSVILPLFPKISELSMKSMSLVRDSIASVTHKISILFFPVFLAAGLFSKIIIDIFYGSSYAGASEMAYIMISLCYFLALSGVIGAVIMGLGRMWLGLSLDVIFTTSFIIILFFAIPTFGAIGLSLTYSCAWGIRLTMLLFVTNRKFGIDFSRIGGIIGVSAAIFITCGYLLFSYPEVGLGLNVLLFVLGASIMAAIGWKTYVSFFRRVRDTITSFGKAT